MGQNTNHIPLPESVIAAVKDSLVSDEFRAYAPPLGFEELRGAIIDDLGAKGATAIITDGGVEALYHICRTQTRKGDEFLTTDPGWKWPALFASAAGAELVEVPVYNQAYDYKLSADRLAERVTPRTKVIYVVDPNNPLGSCISREEMKKICHVARACNALLIHDCTYRDFAYDHTLAWNFYPEKTLTIYSFSKWLGLAGMRVAALVGPPALMSEIAALTPNSLGSNVLSQRAALAGLKSKADWFPAVQATQRGNQDLIKSAVDSLPGFSIPVYPSNGNFLVVECIEAGVKPEALVATLQRRNIMVRHGAYHTPRFGNRFIKISTTVPRAWAVEFCAALPDAVEVARAEPVSAALF